MAIVEGGLHLYFQAHIHLFQAACNRMRVGHRLVTLKVVVESRDRLFLLEQ